MITDEMINNLAVSKEQYNETLLETIRRSKHLKTPKQIAMEKIKCGIGTAEDASIVLGHEMITAEWNRK